MSFREQSSIRGSMKSCGPSTISVAISPLWATGRSRHHVVHDYYRITLPTVVLSEFPCDSGCTTFGILGISQSLADVILVAFSLLQTWKKYRGIQTPGEACVARRRRHHWGCPQGQGRVCAGGNSAPPVQSLRHCLFACCPVPLMTHFTLRTRS